MQPKLTRSPWFQMTKAVLGTAAPLPGANAARPTSGWRQFGFEVGEQIERYLHEFHEFAPAESNEEGELARRTKEFRVLLRGDVEPLLAWIDLHLPGVLAGADEKARREFAAGLTNMS